VRARKAPSKADDGFVDGLRLIKDNQYRQDIAPPSERDFLLMKQIVSIEKSGFS